MGAARRWGQECRERLFTGESGKTSGQWGRLCDSACVLNATELYSKFVFRVLTHNKKRDPPAAVRYRKATPAQKQQHRCASQDVVVVVVVAVFSLKQSQAGF